MKRGSLDLDTHYNIFLGKYSCCFSYLGLGIMPSIASPSMHDAFNKLKWLLIPEEHILDLYLKSLNVSGAQSYAQREDFHDFPVCFFIMT